MMGEVGIHQNGSCKECLVTSKGKVEMGVPLEFVRLSQAGEEYSGKMRIGEAITDIVQVTVRFQAREGYKETAGSASSSTLSLHISS